MMFYINYIMMNINKKEKFICLKYKCYVISIQVYQNNNKLEFNSVIWCNSK